MRAMGWPTPRTASCRRCWKSPTGNSEYCLYRRWANLELFLTVACISNEGQCLLIFNLFLFLKVNMIIITSSNAACIGNANNGVADAANRILPALLEIPDREQRVLPVKAIGPSGIFVYAACITMEANIYFFHSFSVLKPYGKRNIL